MIQECRRLLGFTVMMSMWGGNNKLNTSSCSLWTHLVYKSFLYHNLVRK